MYKIATCSVIVVITSLVQGVLLKLGGVHASTILHYNLLINCMRSPLSFFETTPLGRILNRFSKETDTLDTVIPQVLGGWFMMTFAVFATLTVVAVATPMLLAIAVPVGFVFFFVQVRGSFLRTCFPSFLAPRFICFRAGSVFFALSPCHGFTIAATCH